VSIRALTELSPAELDAFRAEQQAAYDALRAKGLALDLTRGKPSPQQLDLSNAMLDLPNGYRSADGTDVRSYARSSGNSSASTPRRSWPAAAHRS
jgi:hypothetical protein